MSRSGGTSERFVIVQGRYRRWKVWDEDMSRYVATERSWIDAVERVYEFEMEAQARRRRGEPTAHEVSERPSRF